VNEKHTPARSGITRIGNERARQLGQEGWSHEHDDQHAHGELAMAAACYALSAVPYASIGQNDYVTWPWERCWDKRGKHDAMRKLEIAGALIAAEIDRLQRAAIAATAGEKGTG
jgi:hypothetical protein